MHELLMSVNSQTRKKVILDTDAYNEIDDQFAIAYAMLSADKIDLLSINAAPFLNNRSVSAQDGMEKSYDEILRITHLTDPKRKIPVYKGSTSFLKDKSKPIHSQAADNIIKTADESEERIFIVAIGAITNIASAIIKRPDITDKIAVIWLGGHALHYKDTREFNLYQDVLSAQILFDARLPLLVIPCNGVCDYLRTTIPEAQHYLEDKNPLCDYLIDILSSYAKDPFCYSKAIWDVSAIACLTLPHALEKIIIPTPILSSDGYFSFDGARHPYIYVRRLNRDKIFADLFSKLAKGAN